MIGPCRHTTPSGCDQRLFFRWARVAFSHDRVTLAAVTIVTLASIVLASRLELRSSLQELLPEQATSVRELNRTVERIGGVGTLIVVVEGPDVQANKRYLDDLAQSLRQLPPGMIRQLAYRADELRQFFENRFLSYLDIADLNLLYQRLKQRIDYEKVKRTPFFVDLGDASTPLQLDDITAHSRAQFRGPVETVDGYFGGEFGRMLIMIIRPYGTQLTLDRARGLVAAVREAVARLNPVTAGAPITVGLCGNVQSTIEEYDTLQHDILSTAALCIFLVATVISLYFLRLRIVFLLGATLVAGIAWTFAATQLVIGYLNAQTAFLGSIIVGTGINYGIILIARYLEERRRLHPPHDAMERALTKAARPTFLAAATTAVSFLCLLTAHLRGLSQFGFIGAVGVLCCWLATIVVLPSLVLFTERVKGMVRDGSSIRQNDFFAALSRLVNRFPVTLVSLCVGGAIVAAIVVGRFIPNAIEYDFTKLRNQTSVSSGTEALQKRASQLFKHSLSPAIVLLDQPTEGPAVCRAVQKQNERFPPADRRVGSCMAIEDLLPTDQAAKLPLIRRIKKLTTGPWVDKLGNAARQQVKRLQRSSLDRPLTVADLPEALVQHYEDLEGQRGAVAFVNPRPGMLLSDGRNLVRFADTIRTITLPNGRELHPSGEWMIYSDLFSIITHDAPLITCAALVAVIVFVILLVRSARLSLVITMALVWGVVMMVGVCAALGIRINFFNFIVLPLTLGMGVDYAINMAMRLDEAHDQDWEAGLRHTGGAVSLCSLTTMIGYFVLTRATSQALATFGVAAVIGEFTCLASALLLVPSLLVLIRRRRT